MAVDQRYAYISLPDGAEFQLLGEDGLDDAATAEAVRAYLVTHPQPAVVAPEPSAEPDAVVFV